MNRKFYLAIVIGCGITLLTFLSVAGSLASAQKGGRESSIMRVEQAYQEATETPVPGGPGFVTLNSYAFQPSTPDQLYSRFGQILYCDQAYCQFTAGINLPHGAKITKFVLYYYDNSPGDDILAALQRGPLIAEFPSGMALINTQGTGTTNWSSEDSTIVDPVIDNQSNSYYVLVEFANSGHLLHLLNVRVDYVYPYQLPLINK